MIEAAEAVDNRAGVLFIVKNYEGDVMNSQWLPKWPGEKSRAGDERRRGGAELEPTRPVVAGSRAR